jgi:hypothetical protein
LIHASVDLKNLPKVYEIIYWGKITRRYVLKMPDAE